MTAAKFPDISRFSRKVGHTARLRKSWSNWSSCRTFLQHTLYMQKATMHTGSHHSFAQHDSVSNERQFQCCTNPRSSHGCQCSAMLHLLYVVKRQLAICFNGMVNVDLYSAIITKVSNALNMLVSGEKPGFQTLSKGLVVLLCAEVVRQRVPDHGAVHTECSASNSG